MNNNQYSNQNCFRLTVAILRFAVVHWWRNCERETDVQLWPMQKIIWWGLQPVKAFPHPQWRKNAQMLWMQKIIWLCWQPEETSSDAHWQNAKLYKVQSKQLSQMKKHINIWRKAYMWNYCFHLPCIICHHLQSSPYLFLFISSWFILKLMTPFNNEKHHDNYHLSSLL